MSLLSSYIWKLLERIGVKGVSFVVSIVLARILLPEDYGIIAIVTVFINLSNVFVQGGLNTALIQKKDFDVHDYRVVFGFSIIMSMVLYILLFIFAPTISEIYNNMQLISLLRVYSLVLFLCAINSIQVAYLTKKMDFKSVFLASIAAVVVSGAIGILSANLGAGAWALLIQQFTYYIVSVIVMQFKLPWLWGFSLSWERGKQLVSFGWKVLLTNLLSTLFVNIRTLTIGNKYNNDNVAYYSKGKQFPETAMDVVNGSLQTVLLPAFSNKQDDVNQINDTISKTIGIVTYVMFPVMVGLAILAEPVTILLLTEKWRGAIQFMQAYCLCYMTMPIQTTFLQAIKSVGRSDSVLKLYVVFFALQIISIVIGMQLGIAYIMIGDLAVNILFIPMCMAVSKKVLNCQINESVRHIFINLAMSLLMGIPVYIVSIMISSDLLNIVVSTIIGIITYILISLVLRNKNFLFCLEQIKKIKRKRVSRE